MRRTTNQGRRLVSIVQVCFKMHGSYALGAATGVMSQQLQVTKFCSLKGPNTNLNCNIVSYLLITNLFDRNTLVCDCYGSQTDESACSGTELDDGKCDDFWDSTNTTLVKEKCMVTCNYCPSDPCNPEGNTCDTSTQDPFGEDSE